MLRKLLMGGSGKFMAFQPFGYPFDLISPLSPADLRKSIRSQSRSWFDIKSGARGWVVGPLVCLWFRAFERNGPMLFGWISRSARETRVVGRAGSDLDGLLFMVLATPVVVVCIFKLALTGGIRSFELAVLAGGIYALIFGGLLWAKHVFRREAEPLVSFLRDAAKAGPPRQEQSSIEAGAASAFACRGRASFSGLILILNGQDHVGDVTSGVIHEALLGIDWDGFVVLASAREVYLQTVREDGGFIIEMRDGGAARHCRATRSEQPVEIKDQPRQMFTFEEVYAVFIAYASGAPVPAWVAWEPMRW